MRAQLLDGDDTPFGDATAVFTTEFIAELRPRLGTVALATPVFFTDRLSNRVLAGCLQLRDGSCAIALNARFVADPEVIAHTLAEEFIHAQQIQDGVDFEAQRREFAYEDRPYEREAKQLATALLGYEPEDSHVLLLRDAPEGLLFDHVR